MTAEAREPAIEQIENAGRENEPDGVVEVGGGLEKISLLRAIVNAQDRGETAEEIARRHQVRQEINLGALTVIHLLRKPGDRTRAAGDAIAYLDQHGGAERQVDLSARAEADHAKAFAFL